MTEEKLLEQIRRCQKGKVVKFVGAGLVVLNYDWWREILRKQGKEIGDGNYFKPVPDVDDQK